MSCKFSERILAHGGLSSSFWIVCTYPRKGMAAAAPMADGPTLTADIRPPQAHTIFLQEELLKVFSTPSVWSLFDISSDNVPPSPSLLPPPYSSSSSFVSSPRPASSPVVQPTGPGRDDGHQMPCWLSNKPAGWNAVDREFSNTLFVEGRDFFLELCLSCVGIEERRVRFDITNAGLCWHAFNPNSQCVACTYRHRHQGAQSIG